MLALLANFLAVRLFFPAAKPITVPYTAFKVEVAKRNVESIYGRGESIEGRFAKPVTWPPAPPNAEAPEPADRETAAPRIGPAAPAEPRTASDFTTTLPAFVDPGLEQFLIAHGVEISAVPIQSESGWSTLLFGFGPAILLIAFYVWLFRRAARQGGHGRRDHGHRQQPARAATTRRQGTRVTFEDVAGIDEAENELVEIVDFLQGSAEVHAAGRDRAEGRAARRPPGTGKTLLAQGGRRRGRRAVLLHERGRVRRDDRRRRRGARARPVQAGARARARDHLHRRARRHRPRARADGDRRLSEQEQTLNQILTEMDGFSSREGVIVLAATNQPDVLDRRCCGRAASIGASWSIFPTRPAAKRS